MIRSDARGTYRLVWENIEEAVAPPVHMPAVERGETLRVMALVAEGRIDEVAALDWRPGY
jgi:hypothetical protein